MQFTEYTEIALNSTDLIRRASSDDIERRTIKLLGATPIMLELERVTISLMQILQRKGKIYEEWSMVDGKPQIAYINSIQPSAGNVHLRKRTLLALSQVG